MELKDFLRTVITTDSGWFCLSYAKTPETDDEGPAEYIARMEATRAEAADSDDEPGVSAAATTTGSGSGAGCGATRSDEDEWALPALDSQVGTVTSVGTGVDKTTWTEQWFGWPDDIDAIDRRVDELEPTHNVYFSTYLFEQPKSHKKYVKPSRTIVADLDEANVLTCPIKPSILIQTSPERHQGIWMLSEPTDSVAEHERLSKKLTYSIPRCDRSGWALGKRIRVPGTQNFKYYSGPKRVRVVQNNGTMCSPTDLDLLPGITPAIEALDETDFAWVLEAEALDMGPEELFASIATKLPGRIAAMYNEPVKDRSTALWGLYLSCFRAGLKRHHVYYLAKNSAYDKFAGRYGGWRDRALDVMRADAFINHKIADGRTRIAEQRKLTVSVAQRKAAMAAHVALHLQTVGQFIHCYDGQLWYLRHDLGQPIPIMTANERLGIMLDTMFGLNPTEAEAKFAVAHLITQASEMIPTGITGSLSYFDPDMNTLLFHCGRRDVIKISASGIETVPNGYGGVVFPWTASGDLITPRYEHSDMDWSEEVFGDCLDNLVGLNRDDAMALLKVWFIMILLRTGVVSRPILALFGMPGSGKSTLFRRVYMLLYGRDKSLNAVTSADHFDMAAASDPLLVLDNVDTWEKWLPDRLALAAATSEFSKRKLYTNGETYTMKRTAMVGITAHNPKFGREDVTDRLILLNFERLSMFKPETDILQGIMRRRNGLWGGILSDVQKVLAEPQPPDDEVPQFRVEDFSRTGYRIAKAVGMADQFRTAINSLRVEQKSFNLEEDSMLVSAIGRFVAKQQELAVATSPNGVATNATSGRPKKDESWKTPTQMWQQLEAYSGDELTFRKIYRNSIALGKKFWSLQDSLKIVYNVQWKYDTGRGCRVWHFGPLGESEVE